MPHPYAVGAAAAVAALAVSALVNHRLARKAERDNPPAGAFVDVDDVRLHYVERGRRTARPAARQRRHDPGFRDQRPDRHGGEALPRHRFRSAGIWPQRAAARHRLDPEAQADLIHAALRKIGVSRATVLGHSWGASVAVALALKYPAAVGGLVLASGYYYPTVRADVVALSPPAVPVVGDIVRYTLSPSSAG